jgi:Fe-S cluster assembly scaffold protein SufB
VTLTSAELEHYLPQGENARYTPLRVVRDATWQRAEAAPLVSSSVKAIDGVFTVAANTQADITLDWPLPGKAKLATRELNIVVEDNAELTLLEILKGDGWAADSINILLGKNAKVHHAVVQHAAGIVTRSEKISVADNATYNRLALQTQSALSRLDVALTLASHATVNLCGINLCGRNQVLDQTTLLTLNGPGNKCNVQQRNAIAAGGQGIFQGKYYVAQAAQQTDGYMLVRNLLLDDSARAFGKPELEIYADDVKCSHGASTGGLNPEQLFYLKSRGLDDATARQLIVAGFAEELLTGWPDLFLNAAQPVTQGWLAAL